MEMVGHHQEHASSDIGEHLMARAYIITAEHLRLSSADADGGPQCGPRVRKNEVENQLIWRSEELKEGKG